MKDESQYLKPIDVLRLAAVAKIMFTALNARLLTYSAFASATALFAWVLWQPDYLRLAAACAYALMVLWPCQRLDQARIERQESESES